MKLFRDYVVTINHDPQHKILLIGACLMVVAAVLSGAELLGNPSSYFAELSHREFVEEYERYLSAYEEHPWCGTGRMGESEFLGAF